MVFFTPELWLHYNHRLKSNPLLMSITSASCLVMNTALQRSSAHAEKVKGRRFLSLSLSLSLSLCLSLSLSLYLSLSCHDLWRTNTSAIGNVGLYYDPALACSVAHAISGQRSMVPFQSLTACDFERGPSPDDSFHRPVMAYQLQNNRSTHECKDNSRVDQSS